MVDEKYTGSYQLLDNYTIWTLETLPQVPKTLSLTPSTAQTSAHNSTPNHGDTLHNTHPNTPNTHTPNPNIPTAPHTTPNTPLTPSKNLPPNLTWQQKLEMIKASMSANNTPIRTALSPALSLVTPNLLLSQPIEGSPHLKRSMLNNLLKMKDDIDGKIEKIREDLGEDDVMSRLPASNYREAPPYPAMEKGSILDEDEECGGTCRHAFEVGVLQRKIENMEKKSDEYNTASNDPNFKRLITENKLLQEKLKVAIANISQLNSQLNNKTHAWNQDNTSETNNTHNNPPTNTHNYLPTKINNAFSNEVLQKSVRETRDCVDGIKEEVNVLNLWIKREINKGSEHFSKLLENIKKISENGYQAKRKLRETPSNESANKKPPTKPKPPPIPPKKSKGPMKTHSTKTTNPKKPLTNGNSIDSTPSIESSETRSIFGSEKDQVKLDVDISPSICSVADVTHPFNRTKRNIRAHCRILPSLGDKASVVTAFEHNNGLQVVYKNRVKNFECDSILEPSQDAVLRTVEGSIENVTKNKNACILMYGQNSSGKTFTLEGNSQEKGLLKMALEILLQKSSVVCSVAELKNDIFRDVLNDDARNAKLETKQAINESIEIVGWVKEVVDTVEDFNKILKKVKQFRRSNPSPHAHIIHSFTLNNQLSSTGKLIMVDLASSERLDKQQLNKNNTKDYQTAAKNLVCLGDVLQAINSRQSHVPHRSSKLTHFLQDTLQSDSGIELVVHIKGGEESASETTATLMFAQRIRANETSSKPPVSKTTPMAPKPDVLNSTIRPKKPGVTVRPTSPALFSQESRVLSRKNSVSSDIGSVKSFQTPKFSISGNNV